jgi:hypothetical protein
MRFSPWVIKWRYYSGMSEALQFTYIQCPYCGENLEIQVDCSEGSQSYIEDCQVCCCAIEMRLTVGLDDWHIEAMRDDQ